MKSRIKDCPKFDKDFIGAAVKSVEVLEGLLEWEFERELWEGLRDAFGAFYGEAVDGLPFPPPSFLCFSDNGTTAYIKYLQIDNLIIALPHTSLLRLLTPTNPTCQLLLAHIVALHLSMRPISCRERKQYTVSFYGIRMSSWIPNIYAGLDEKWKGYLRWPMLVAGLHIQGELEGFSLGKGKAKGLVYDINAGMGSEGMVRVDV